jgi:cytidine deaminase
MVIQTLDADQYFDPKVIKQQLEFSQCGMSGVKVAACLIGKNKENEFKAFYGSNIEISRGNVYHAEEVALIKAISEGYTELWIIFLTSNDERYLVPLCYSCRAIFNYINPRCSISVLDKDLNLKESVILSDTMKYPYQSRGFIK